MKKLCYYESFPHVITVSISVVINTIFVFMLYFSGLLKDGNLLGIVLILLGISLFAEGTLLIIACSSLSLWKHRQSKIEIITDIREFRIVSVSILIALTVAIVILFLLRNQGYSLFLGLILLLYLPFIVSWLFIEKTKVYVEDAGNISKELY